MQASMTETKWMQVFCCGSLKRNAAAHGGDKVGGAAMLKPNACQPDGNNADARGFFRES